MYYTSYITLDLNTISSFVLTGAKQGDNNSRQIIASILYNGVPYTIPDSTQATYRIRRPDGKSNQGIATIQGNKVYFTLTAYDLAIAGRAYADIELTQNITTPATRLGTCSFVIDIQAMPLKPTDATESEAFSYLTAMVETAADVIAQAEAWAIGTKNTVAVSSDDPTYKNNARYYANLLANAKVGTVTNTADSRPSATVVWDKTNEQFQFNFNIPTIISTGPSGRGITNIQASDSQNLLITYTDGSNQVVGPINIINIDGSSITINS